MHESCKLTIYSCCRPEEYKKKVSEYVRKYASEEALRQAEATAVSSSSESSMSDFSEDEAQVIFITISTLKSVRWHLAHYSVITKDLPAQWMHPG